MSQIYPSDLTDTQWAILEPMIPTTREGRPRVVDMRKIMNGVFYRCRSGCCSVESFGWVKASNEL